MSRAFSAARWLLHRLTELCMVALAVITLADVLGRYVFNVSLVGAVEMTEILMVGVIFTGIVLATIKREHIAVDLLATTLGPRTRRVQHLGSQLLAVGISVLLGAVTWHQAVRAWHDGDQTTMLGLPLAPTVFFMSVMLLLNAAVLLFQFWVDLRSGARHD